MKHFIAVLLSLMLCISPLLPVQGDAAETALSLLAINVRKADALLLRSGNSVYLIDTGTEESYGKLYSVLKREGIGRLTGVIKTGRAPERTAASQYRLR